MSFPKCDQIKFDEPGSEVNGGTINQSRQKRVFLVDIHNSLKNTYVAFIHYFHKNAHYPVEIWVYIGVAKLNGGERIADGRNAFFSQEVVRGVFAISVLEYKEIFDNIECPI